MPNCTLLLPSCPKLEPSVVEVALKPHRQSFPTLFDSTRDANVHARMIRAEPPRVS